MKHWMKFMCVSALGVSLTGCAHYGGSTVHTRQGAVVGGVLGAGAGGIVGHQSGRGLEGAAVGGAIGSLAGALFGSAEDERYDHQRVSTSGHRSISSPPGPSHHCH